MKNRLAHLDLKLLVALQTLLEEKNVTQAADRLCVTQPAMSKMLSRLREQFDDPLLTRSAHGLVPTPKAESLRGPLTHVLNELEELIVDTKFDLSDAEGTVRILFLDAATTNIVIDLWRELAECAPKIRLEVQSHINIHMPAGDDLELLRRGIFDFSLSVRDPRDLEFQSTELSSGAPVCWMSKTHPLVGQKELSWEDIDRYPRVALYLSPLGEEMISQLNSERGGLTFGDSQMFRTSSLLMALEAVSRHNALMISSALLRHLELAGDKIVMRPVPAGVNTLNVASKLYLVQHARTISSPLHRWIRNKLSEFASKYSQ